MLPEKYRSLSTVEILHQLKYAGDLQSLLRELGVPQKTLTDHRRYCSLERDELLTVIINLLQENSRLRDERDQAQGAIAFYH